MKNKMERFNALKAMNTLVKLLNNEDAYFEWINTVEDEADDESLMETVEIEDIFKEAVSDFRNIMKRYGKDGFYLDGKVY